MAPKENDNVLKYITSHAYSQKRFVFSHTSRRILE